MLKKDIQKIIEQKACNIFRKALDPEFFELDEKNGNFPAVDGMIQLMQQIEKSRVYSAKSLYYQIKGKDPEFYDEKWNFYDFDASHLEHFSKCDLPVILIIVNVESEAIFWKYLDQKSCEIGSSKKQKRIYAENEFLVEDAYVSWGDLLNMQGGEKITKKEDVAEKVPIRYLNQFNSDSKRFSKNTNLYIALLKIFNGDSVKVEKYMKLSKSGYLAIKTHLIDTKILEYKKGVMWFYKKEGVLLANELINRLVRQGHIDLTKLINFNE